MKLLNPNTPLSNFIYTIINEKNKQIKENILLGKINFPKILIYSTRKEENTFKSDSHLAFLNNLDQQKQLSEVREEKANLEKKVDLVDHQLLSIKNYNFSQNKLNYSQRYINTNLNNNKYDTNNNSKINYNRYSSEKNSKSKNKSKKRSIENKNENINSLPTLGKEQIRRKKKVQNIALKPIQIKSFKSKSKINNQETEEKLEKNAKAFIQKINNNKKNVLAMINKRQEKFTLKLKNELEKIERQRKLKYDEYNNKNNMNNNNLYNYNNGYNNDNYNLNINNVEYSDLNTIRREENKYSPNISNIRNNRIRNKKYYHYSPYNLDDPKMLKNISKDLLNFNSELYYNNNMPDILQYQILLAPLYNNNVMNKNGSTRMLNFDEMDNLRNINNINNTNLESVEMTNGDIVGNTSKNNYSNRNDESNIDNSFNKKHLYYFNEPKYEIEVTSPEN
jgi:hypothetical protein